MDGCVNESASATVKDPVCGMEVNPGEAAGSLTQGGQTYYFCSTHCLEKFRSGGEKYAAKSTDKPHLDVGGSLYTCPMHPEVRSDKPGACPKCGMALERVIATAEEEDSSELRDMTRRFWVSLTLTVPVFAMAMAHVARLDWLQLLLSTPAVLWGGWPFFKRGWASIIHRSLNMFTLIAIDRKSVV